MARHKKLFMKPPNQKHLLTDIKLWQTFLDLRRNSESTLADVLYTATRLLSSGNLLASVNDPQNAAHKTKPEEKTHNGDEKLMKSVRNYAKTLSVRSTASEREARLYKDLSDDIRNDIAKEGTREEIKASKRQLKKIKTGFDKSQSKTTLKYKKYMAAMVAMEQAEISRLINPGEVTDSAVNQLKERITRCENEYQTCIETDKAIFRDLIRAANYYENVWKFQEMDRSRSVMKCLVSISNSDTVAPSCFRDLLHMKEAELREMIDKRVEREEMEIPRFQKFKMTFKNPVEADGDIQVVSDRVPDVRVKVMEPYKRQSTSEIDLVEGMELEQILPPNKEGFAYGSYKKSLFSRTKKGFYPADKVRPKAQTAPSSTRQEGY